MININHSFLAALLCLAPGLALAAEGTPTPVGEVTLASGLAAHYAYHFDRNALLASHRAGDSLVALTRSGNLLRFDATTIQLTREWSGPVPATCLGRGEGDAVLVGFEDGRVCRVEPNSLGLDEVAKLPGKVQWVGVREATGGRTGLVAVIEDTKWDARYRVYMRSRPSTVHDLATGRTFPLKSKSVPLGDGLTTEFVYHPTAILLDGRRRLWLGDALSDWGGWCLRIDFDEGRLVEVVGPRQHPEAGAASWEGIDGFVEFPDGRIWAHGGSDHMGYTSGFICRVEGPRTESLYRYSRNDARKGREDGVEFPESKQPYEPIFHILPDGGDLLVFCDGAIYRVGPRLEGWSKDRTLKIHYRSGHPDAFGAYSPIVAFHRLGDRLLCATAADGYVGVSGGAGAAHVLPGQLGIDRVEHIADSAEGTLFLSWDTEEPTWRLGPGGWEVAALAPPIEPDPGKPQAEDEDLSWGETRVMVGRGGAIWTVSGPGWGPGTITTARRVGGKSEVLGREGSSMTLAACFITPDGILWNTSAGELKRFVQGRWVDVAKLPEAEPGVPRFEGKGENVFQLVDTSLQVGYGLRAVGDAGPPWLLLDRDNMQLLRLAHGPDFKDPRLDAVKVVEAGAALKVHGAIPWSKGEILLATDKGLRRFAIATSAVRPSPLPDPGRPITSLARDGLGRVWLAGEGLWLVDPDGKRLHDCGALPMIGRTPVATIAEDPGHRDGVIASLGGRGVVFVRVAGVSDGAAR